MNVIIIPAYKPTDRLTLLVDEIRYLNSEEVVVIDDGSKEEFASLFRGLEEKGCHVLHHSENLGKGAAIKSGILFAQNHFKSYTGYVTCDADGQHLAEDIIAVSATLETNPNSIILGLRDLHQSGVPFKSRFGNRFSSLYFKLITGVSCADTQTGLRGIPKSLTQLALGIMENRYDFEMTFLIRSIQEKVPMIQVSIATVYEDNNRSSHFRPIVDSIKIYKEPLKFLLASITCAILDLAMFSIIISVLNNNILVLVSIATISARIISGILNFVLNRIWSFQNFNSLKPQFLKYFVLYIMILLSSIFFVSLFSFLPIHLTIIKIIVDGLLFIVSFIVQKNWVFQSQRE